MQVENCPRCGSNNFWSDYSSSGCKDCGYAFLCGQVTLALAKAPKELPLQIQEIARHFDEQSKISHDTEVYRDSQCAF